VVATGPGGVSHRPANAQRKAHTVYRVQLPAAFPLQLQAAHLYTQLRYLRDRHPRERLSLAGHSAGGVVARLVVVGRDAPRIDGLITIAAPNLGTSRAIDGLEVVDSKPFFCPGPGIDFLKSVFGGGDYDYLKYSRGALADLTPALPGTLIGWLNQQPHPDIDYHAVVRAPTTPLDDTTQRELDEVIDRLLELEQAAGR